MWDDVFFFILPLGLEEPLGMSLGGREGTDPAEWVSGDLGPFSTFVGWESRSLVIVAGGSGTCLFSRNRPMCTSAVSHKCMNPLEAKRVPRSLGPTRRICCQGGRARVMLALEGAKSRTVT